MADNVKEKTLTDMNLMLLIDCGWKCSWCYNETAKLSLQTKRGTPQQTSKMSAIYCDMFKDD